MSPQATSDSNFASLSPSASLGSGPNDALAGLAAAALAELSDSAGPSPPLSRSSSLPSIMDESASTSASASPSTEMTEPFVETSDPTVEFPKPPKKKRQYVKRSDYWQYRSKGEPMPTDHPSKQTKSKAKRAYVKRSEYWSNRSGSKSPTAKHMAKRRAEAVSNKSKSKTQDETQDVSKAGKKTTGRTNAKKKAPTTTAALTHDAHAVESLIQLNSSTNPAPAQPKRKYVKKAAYWDDKNTKQSNPSVEQGPASSRPTMAQAQEAELVGATVADFVSQRSVLANLNSPVKA